MFLGYGYIFAGLVNPELSANRAKWQQSEPQSYSYIVRPACFCSIDSVLSYVVTVQSGLVTALVEDQWGPDYSGMLVDKSKILTIERVFEIASTSLAEADVVKVTYDDTFGYPVSVSIDRSRATIDDEYRLEILDFKVL